MGIILGLPIEAKRHNGGFSVNKLIGKEILNDFYRPVARTSMLKELKIRIFWC